MFCCFDLLLFCCFNLLSFSTFIIVLTPTGSISTLLDFNLLLLVGSVVVDDSFPYGCNIFCKNCLISGENVIASLLIVDSIGLITTGWFEDGVITDDLGGDIIVFKSVIIVPGV